jgi:hypothetical protein
MRERRVPWKRMEKTRKKKCPASKRLISSPHGIINKKRKVIGRGEEILLSLKENTSG